jgi:hypothetical protein
MARTGHVLQKLNQGKVGLNFEEVIEKMKHDLHPAQRDFATDNSTEILGLCAGYGSGKTRALICKTVFLAWLNQGFTGCVMEPTGPLIRDIWIHAFNSVLDDYELPYTFRASPLPEYILHFPGGDTRILCRSFENTSRIIGLDLAFVLADEIDTVNPKTCDEAFPRILGRLRSGNVRQFAAASTPEGFRWMWKNLGSEEAKEKEDRKLIKMRTVDNPHLPQDFIDRMKANYDPNLLQAYLNGEFVNLTSGQVYDRFDRDKHITNEEVNIDNEPLRIGVDFNVTNMSAVIGIRRGNNFIIVDEISGSHDTDTLGREIRDRYPSHIIYMYPDASGGNRSTNATRTDIQILQDSYRFSNQSPSANPPVRDRVLSVQAMLENGKGETRIKISSKCKRLIECLELQSYNDKQEPDKDAGYDHMNDALGYIIWRDFNPLHSRAGRGTGVRLY